MPCLIWQAADVAKTSLFRLFAEPDPPSPGPKGPQGSPAPTAAFGKPYRGGQILPLDPRPLLGLSLIWLFASSGGRQSLSFRGKAVLGTSLDGAIRAELPPKAPGAEVYKVIPLLVPFYGTLEPTWKKSYLVFLSGLNGFNQQRGFSVFIPPSLARPAGEIGTCLRRRKDLMNCKRMRLYLPSRGYALVGSCHLFYFFPSQLWKIYINPLFLQLMVPLKVKTPGFKGQS